jgi:hypothetical protein
MKGNSLAGSIKLHTRDVVETNMEDGSNKKNTNKRKEKSRNIYRD